MLGNWQMDHPRAILWLCPKKLQEGQSVTASPLAPCGLAPTAPWVHLLRLAAQHLGTLQSWLRKTKMSLLSDSANSHKKLFFRW